MKISKRVIDNLKPPESGSSLFIWDSELRGYGVRVSPQRRIAFIIQYRTPQGSTRRYSFAIYGPTTPEQARAQARQLLAVAAAGRDPSTERHEARKALTVRALCDAYMEALRAGQVLTRFGRPKRESTAAIDEGRVSRHIVPLIGNKVASLLSTADVQHLVDGITAGKTAGTFVTKARGKAVVEGGPGTAARVVELLGGIWSWARRRGLVSGASPVTGVERHHGEPRDRTLDARELESLGRVLAARPGPAASAVHLIALTGLRQNEAAGLSWSEVEVDCLRLERTKTGRSTRPIGRAASALLAGLTRNGPLVFGKPPTKKQIAGLFDLAGLADARSHSLRRTFASTAATLGYGDATISELLGHARRGVTERHYVRRPDAMLIEAASKTADVIAAALFRRDDDSSDPDRPSFDETATRAC
jgi:integrase